MTQPTFIIGIDLGTTNSIIAYTEADLSGDRTPEIRILQIPQIVGRGAVERRDLLPSFIYLPAAQEVGDGGFPLPWNPENRVLVGEFARDRGAEVPQRLISSSKSWLCNPLIDRNKPVLPWEGPPDVEKMSPVAASALILSHIRDTWNHVVAAGDEARNIEHQDIFLTVPASFDAVARELTLQAARQAGFSQVTLLEEPQAAFYAWIEASRDQWRRQVKKGDRVLVCDVGGGTSDFSLIHVTEDGGELVLERVAVGDHLLVGGDNMDLTLAYGVGRKMAASGHRLDAWQMRGLVHACRRAKEAVLSDPTVAAHPVTILGRGSRLIGGTLKSDVSRQEIETAILDGFFPVCEPTALPVKPQKIGLQEAGLSYESDPAITRHLAKFLNQQRAAADGGSLPTAVLFNGGVMKSEKVRRRVVDILNSWGAEAASSGVREIPAHDFDLSVARGAACYGLARRGRGVRIRGGLGRSYYIGIAASMPAVPGMPAPVKALCVAPFGTEEGTDIHLTSQEFVLAVGEPVRFEFLGSTARKTDTAGEIVEDWHGDIEEITSLETTLDGDPGQMARVGLDIRVTEIGTLEIWCAAREDDRKWKLEFNVREQDETGV